MTTGLVLAILQTLGILLGGAAAAYGEVNRRRLKTVHKEVNGQTQLLVSTTHALGVAEGVAQEAARTNGDAHEAPA